MKSNRAKVRRELDKLLKENKSLKQKVWRHKKRAERARKKLQPSPNTKVNRDTKGQKLSPDVRRKLVLGEILHRQVKQSLNLKSLRERQAAYKILSGSMIKHYRMTGYLGISSLLLRKYRKKPNNNSSSEITNLEYERPKRQDQTIKQRSCRQIFRK